MKTRRAEVLNNGRRAGVLTREPGRYLFSYDADYYADEQAPAISLTLPKTQRLYISEALFPFFAGLLAEGTNKSIQTEALRLDEQDSFGLLLATAQVQTIGAITVRELLTTL